MVNETESSNRRLVTILAIGALLLAIVVGIIIVVLVLGDRDSGEGVTATAANLMPDDTLFFLSMNPDFTAADNFDVIRRAWGGVPGFAEVVDDWPAVLFKDVEELDYEADIASWLGSEISFGMTGDIAEMMLQGAEMSFSGEPGEAPQIGEIPEIPQFIITAASQDTTASDRFLAKLRAEIEKEGTLLKETDYKGFQVVYSEPLPEEDVSVAYATVDESIVFTVGGLETLQMAIDARDGDSLADSETFEKTTAALPEGSLGFGYVNAGPLVDALLGSLEEMSDAVGVSELAALQTVNPEQLRAFQGVGFSLSFDPKGIRFDAVVVYDKGSLPESLPSTASLNKAIEHAPADTLLYISSVNLGGTLKSIVDLVLTQPELELEDFGESLEMLESQLGFKLDDIYEALSGEFSLAVSYEAAGIMGDPSVPIGVLLQLENKKPETFKQLMNLAGLVLLGSESDMVETVEIGDVSATLVTGPAGEPLVGWGLSEEFFALGTSQALLETAFDGGDKLANDATFKGVIAALPEKNTGYFYLNLAKGIDILYQAMSSWEQEDFDREARAILAPIKAIGAAGEPFSSEKDSVSTALFILLEGQ